MADQLIQRREEAITRHDAALDRWWPDKTQPEYQEEVLAVTRELEEVVALAGSEGWSRVEQSRTLRWLADAYADLSKDEKVASGEDLAWLSRAAATYLQAEPLCTQEESPRDFAVLNFNYANTLRRFNIENTSLLKSAQRRYEIALDFFSEQEPQLVPRVQQALDSVNVLLQLAPLAKAREGIQQRLEHLDELMKGGADSSLVRAEIMRVMEGGGPQGLLYKIVDLVSEMPESVRQQDPDGKLQGLVSHALTLCSGTSIELEQDAEIMNALGARLQREIDCGNVDLGRVDVVNDAIASLGKVISGGGDDISSIRARMLDLRASAESLIPAMKDMSYGLSLPEAGSRAAAARELFWGARKHMLQTLTLGGQTESERSVLYDFARTSTELDKRLVEAAGDDSLALQIEAESIRPAIVQLREFAARNRPYLASPLWNSSPLSLDSAAVTFCGDETLEGVVANWCEKSRMHLLKPPHGSGYADARWQQLASSNLSVFDMTPGPGNEQAATAYQLGIAMTLGKSVVVVSRSSERLPFDIDLPAVEPGDCDNDDATALEHALASACYWIPAEGTETSVLATIDEARRQFAESNATEIDQSLKELTRLRNAEDLDSIEAGRILTSLLSFADSSAPLLITPAWSGIYPVPGEHRLFHVMPFGPEWADAAADVARTACDMSGVEYVRGDMVADPRIIRSIWQELCQASHVLVDITGFNANVAFELGIAHTLGKKVLIVGQEETIENLFDMIEKHRVTTYAPDSLQDDLSTAISDWLGS
jgi:nucleoside 2-deoxyribosyltransferase